MPGGNWMRTKEKTMTQLVWSDTGKRFFETGIDRAVLYLMDSNGRYPLGVPWNGLVSLTESPSGAEPNPLYGDNIKYLTLMAAEGFVPRRYGRRLCV